MLAKSITVKWIFLAKAYSCDLEPVELFAKLEIRDTPIVPSYCLPPSLFHDSFKFPSMTCREHSRKLKSKIKPILPYNRLHRTQIIFYVFYALFLVSRALLLIWWVRDRLVQVHWLVILEPDYSWIQIISYTCQIFACPIKLNNWYTKMSFWLCNSSASMRNTFNNLYRHRKICRCVLF